MDKVIEYFELEEDGNIAYASLEWIDSGAFDYGNGKSIVLKTKYSNQLFDARYDNRFNKEESFRKYAYEFIRDYIRKSIKVTRIEKDFQKAIDFMQS